MARGRRRPPRPGALTELPPLKILSQIALLQAIYYVSGCALLLFTALVAGKTFSLDLVFSWRSLRGDTTAGWMVAMVWMMNSFVGAISLLFLISRSKLIPDFALTIHFLHLVAVSFYSHSLPTNMLWWALQICSAAFMIFLGVWSCRWRELRPINFGGAAAAAAPTSDGGAGRVDPSSGDRGSNAGLEPLGDEEQGFGRGSRRGKGRDGAGEYEMVGMKGNGAG